MPETEATLAALIANHHPLPGDADPESYDIIASGHIDSVAFVRFVAEIEEAFDVEFSNADLESDAFRTLRGLQRLVERKRAVE